VEFEFSEIYVRLRLDARIRSPINLGGKDETIDLDDADLLGGAGRCSLASPGGESGLGKVAADP